jgi:hypothetical protein
MGRRPALKKWHKLKVAFANCTVFPDNLPRGGGLVYGGEDAQKRSDVTVVPFYQLYELLSAHPQMAFARQKRVR